MEVKAGYKQTDVGIVPEDWEVFLLSECSKRIKDGEHWTPRRSKSGYYLLSARNILNSRIDLSDVDYVEEDEYRRIRLRCNPEEGDVLISCSGTVGRVAVVPKGLECVMVRSAAMVKPDHRKLNGIFAQYFLQSAVGQKQIALKINQGAQPNLFLNHIEDLPIPLPPTLAEQEAIAEALSDADALIKALEQLLAKKRQVKQGAMQELLTGKKRLVESEKWGVKRLGEVFEITAGGDFEPKQSSDVQDEHHPYPIYSNALTDKGLYGFCSYNDHRAGSITVTARGTLGSANYRDHDFTAIGRVLVLKPLQPLDGRFIAEYLNNRVEFVVESTGVPQLTAPQISKYEILFPEFPEQTAISEILSDMDTEISALEGKLSKARQVKQGMMSVLLTGRVRLV